MTTPLPAGSPAQVASLTSAASTRAAPSVPEGDAPTSAFRGLTDIGANLLDEAFDLDVESVIARSRRAGVDQIIVTAGSLEEAKKAAAFATRHGLVSTVGIHPTRSLSVTEEAVADTMAELEAVYKANPGVVVAVGECGLDRAREHFSPLAHQKIVWEAHFDLAKRTGLPMFLHSRDCPGEILEVLRRRRGDMTGGAVIHSFDGTLEDMQVLTQELGLYIGINGCSLRTAESLAVAAAIPLDKLLLETDAPYCDMRATHASSAYFPKSSPWVTEPVVKRINKDNAGKVTQKSRSEPRDVLRVLHVLAALRNEDPQVMAAAVRENTKRLFGV